MNSIIEQNYSSIIKRGLITNDTTMYDFIDKIFEEAYELQDFADKNQSVDPEEIADIILVCLNMARHYNIDIEKELVKKIIKNQNR